MLSLMKKLKEGTVQDQLVATGEVNRATKENMEAGAQERPGPEARSAWMKVEVDYVVGSFRSDDSCTGLALYLGYCRLALAIDVLAL